jgi:hypothetical protein
MRLHGVMLNEVTTITLPIRVLQRVDHAQPNSLLGYWQFVGPTGVVYFHASPLSYMGVSYFDEVQ